MLSTAWDSESALEVAASDEEPDAEATVEEEGEGSWLVQRSRWEDEEPDPMRWEGRLSKLRIRGVLEALSDSDSGTSGGCASGVVPDSGTEESEPYSPPVLPLPAPLEELFILGFWWLWGRL